MDQALNSQKTPHTSPLRASYGMSFVSILMKNDRVIKGFYCISLSLLWKVYFVFQIQEQHEASMRPKKEKKKKFIRTAAGVVWEDPSLSEWDKGLCGSIMKKCYPGVGVTKPISSVS